MNNFTSPRVAAVYTLILFMAWVAYENYMTAILAILSIASLLLLVYAVTVISANRWMTFKEFRETWKL